MIINFIKKIINHVKIDDTISSANDMTFKLFFSIFPFSIFLMSIMGFLNFDVELLTAQILFVLPDSLADPVSFFIKEITTVKNFNILSFSLIGSIYGASSGFKTAMRSINKAYGRKDMRKFFVKIIISVILVFIFTVIIIISFALLIFGKNILDFIKNNFMDYMSKSFIYLLNISRYALSIIIMFFSVILINKLALYKNKKTSIKSLFPGTAFTVFSWVAISGLFNIYIDNFSNYSALYGSIAAVIILMLWLNIMCIVLLLGSEINAVIISL